MARELTKIHEEFHRGTLSDASRYYDEHPARGEVTVVVAPASADTASDQLVEELGRALAAELLAQGMKPSQAAKEIARRLDVPRNTAYRMVHDLEAE